MCSFLLTTLVVSATLLHKLNEFMVRRGPDATNVVTVHNITMIHNLLHMTGTPTLQPVHDPTNNVYCLFNGEIYNYKEHGDFKTDTECIIPLYEKYGNGFATHLDGEFAVCIIDFQKRLLVLASDPFATKPLWVYLSPFCICIATYKSALDVLHVGNGAFRMPSNTCITVDMDTQREVCRNTVVIWDLRQFKLTTDDWEQAFVNAVRKRTDNVQHDICIGLSSGYDSGAIACVLGKLGVTYHTYSITATENRQILDARLARHNQFADGSATLITLTKEQFEHSKNDVHTIVEPANLFFPVTGELYSVCLDNGAVGLAHIANLANLNNHKVMLSSQGADEIMSDYGFNGKGHFAHSQFGGLFPQHL